MTILEFDARLIVDSDHFLFAVIGGATVPICRLEKSKIPTLAHCDAMARGQFARAQQPVGGQLPGPGGMYPAGFASRKKGASR